MSVKLAAVAESWSRVLHLVSILLKLPLPVVQRTHLPCLQPTRDTVEMERMIADSPGYCALLRCGRGLVGLALYAEIHDVVPANGTVVHNNVPGPKSHCIPLLSNRDRVLYILSMFMFTVTCQNKYLGLSPTQAVYKYILKRSNHSFLTDVQHDENCCVASGPQLLPSYIRPLSYRPGAISF